MGRSIYFTDKEIQLLRDTSSEWCSMMGDGDEEAVQCVEDRLKDGLGSALKKLHKGTKGEEVYKGY